MDKIEVKILNPEAIKEAERMMVAMGRLTQRSHKISNMADFEALFNADYKQSTAEAMAALPHPTIQKFGLINIAIVGASRRFLAQITRHQNEVKFMSGSLQYSDYTDSARFCIPYEMTTKDVEEPIIGPYGQPYTDYYTSAYIKSCEQAEAEYEAAIKAGIGNDAAGYMMPQGLRNVLVISALPYELKHIISQRVCNRNTLETQYVMLLIWEQLWELSPMFRVDIGPSCLKASKCAEGKMSCGRFLNSVKTMDDMFQRNISLPTAILDNQFKYIRGTEVYKLIADNAVYETCTAYKNGDPVEGRNK